MARRGRAPESADDDVPADRAEREDGCEGNSEAHGDVPLGHGELVGFGDDARGEPRAAAEIGRCVPDILRRSLVSRLTRYW